MEPVPTVVVIRDNVVNEHILCTKENCEKVFLEKCAEVFPNWHEYTPVDIESVLDDGYEQGNNCSVCLSWAMPPDMKVDWSKVYKDGLCPDCGEPIPIDAVNGDSCKNCGHVFYSDAEEQ